MLVSIIQVKFSVNIEVSQFAGEILLENIPIHNKNININYFSIRRFNINCLYGSNASRVHTSKVH
jgi:hypothetical protein